MEKRKNFSELEAEAFLCCLEKFKHIVENKKTDSVSNKKKAQAWENLTGKFNSFPGVCKRNTKQLLTYYKNLKRKGNKSQSDRIIKLFKTGGGPSESIIVNHVEDRLMAMGAIKTRLINPYDSDATYHKMTNSDTTTYETNCDQEDSHDVIEVDISESFHSIEGLFHDEVHAASKSQQSAVQASTSQQSAVQVSTSRQSAVQASTSQQSAVQVSASQQSAVQASTSQQNAVQPSISEEKESEKVEHFASTVENNNPSNTSNKNSYKLRKSCKNTTASSKVADSLIEHSELKKKLFAETHEFERQRFNLEKEKFVMAKERHEMEMKLYNAQLKMYEMINEKIEKEKMGICVLM